MRVYSDEVITFSITYAETTPESVEIGDFSETGFERNSDTCDMCNFMFYLEDMTEMDSADWFSSEWYTTCYKTGTERQTSMHLDNAATDRMREIWEAARKNDIELIDIDDDEYDHDRDEGLPVPFIHMTEFNKMQLSLALNTGV